MIEDLGEIDVDGARLETALARLEWVWGLIVRRGEQLETEADAQGVPRYTARFTGPAFVVHARNVPALAEDPACRKFLQRLAAHGGNTGVVAKLYGSVEEISTAFAAVSGELTAALMTGRTLQVVTVPEQSFAGSAARPAALVTGDDSVRYSEQVSAEIWTALALRDTAALAQVFEDLWAESEQGALLVRRYIADALRRSADVLSPASGVPPMPCPLCIASPLFPPDEFQSHLVQTHAALAEGVAVAGR
jgi:hypothetical protein